MEEDYTVSTLAPLGGICVIPMITDLSSYNPIIHFGDACQYCTNASFRRLLQKHGYIYTFNEETVPYIIANIQTYLAGDICNSILEKKLRKLLGVLEDCVIVQKVPSDKSFRSYDSLDRHFESISYDVLIKIASIKEGFNKTWFCSTIHVNVPEQEIDSDTGTFCCP